MKKLSLIFSVFLLSACSQSTLDSNPSDSNEVVCTQEAKLCPDGTSVGRMGPNCEFPDCPELPQVQNENVTSSRPKTDLTFDGSAMDEKSGITFKYPKTLADNYSKLLIDAGFEPKVQVSKADFSCGQIKSPNDPSSESFEDENGSLYCRKIISEGAAGSNYKTYTYSIKRADQVFSLIFVIQQVNCGNFDDAERIECEKKHDQFDPNALAISIFDTFSYPS